MSSNLITQPYGIILDPTGGGGRAKPVANGRYHVGIIDLDPVANPRTDLAYKDESGTERPLTSPLILNNSGAFVVSENDGTLIQPYMKDSVGHSVLITDKRGTPVYSDNHVGDPGNLTEKISELTLISYDSVSDMLAGNPLTIGVGGRCSTGGTLWERVAVSTPAVISDFVPLSDLSFSDFGGVCDGVASDDDALDLAVSACVYGSVISLAGTSRGGQNTITLRRHHIYNKSNITIDFAGYDYLWDAPTGYIPDRTGNFVSNTRSPGQICFRGSLTGEEYAETLSSILPEFSEIYPVPGVSSAFGVDSWWLMLSDSAPGAPSGKEINYLVQSQGNFGNPNEVRMNYRSGWELASGRTITYKKAVPVSNIKILNIGNMYYNQTITDGSGSGDAFKSEQASSVFSFEIAYDYEVTRADFHDIPYVAVFEQWVNNGRENYLRVTKPTLNRSDQIVNRNGALYCKAKGLENKSGRHVIDHTSAAYCTTTCSTETGTKQGAFTTHGSFEHDLHFENTTGVMSIANSGADFGESAKRITVQNHNGSQLIADNKVIDLTVIDSVFDKFARVNNDGFTSRNMKVKNPSGQDGLRFYQKTNETGRGSYLSGGEVDLYTGSGKAIPEDIEEPIKFSKVKIENFINREISGLSTVSLINCESETQGGANDITCKKFKIDGGNHKLSLEILNGCEEFTIGGGVSVNGSGPSATNKLINFNQSSGSGITINIGNVVFNPDTGGTYSIALSNSVSPIKYSCSGATFNDGKIQFQTGLPAGSYINHRGNVEVSVIREDVPTESSNVSTLDNMII